MLSLGDWLVDYIVKVCSVVDIMKDLAGSVTFIASSVRIKYAYTLTLIVSTCKSFRFKRRI